MTDERIQKVLSKKEELFEDEAIFALVERFRDDLDLKGLIDDAKKIGMETNASGVRLALEISGKLNKPRFGNDKLCVDPDIPTCKADNANVYIINCAKELYNVVPWENTTGENGAAITVLIQLLENKEKLPC